MIASRSSLFDTHIIAHSLVPEFSPALQMKACGCSDNVLNDMNAWLLERFGERRTTWMVCGMIFAHPNTVELIKKSVSDHPQRR